MKPLRVVIGYPFTAMFVAGLLLGAIVDRMGVHYDSSGFGSVLFYLSLLLAFPVWIAHELLSSADVLRALYISKWIAAALGLIIALGFDYVLSRVRKQLE